jgi:ATP-dependent Clp protease ATP-binding subunit ClpA
MNNIFEPIQIKGKLVAKELSTGRIATKGEIRDIQIRNAFKENQHILVDPISGRITRIAKPEGSGTPRKLILSSVTSKKDPEIMFNNLRNLTRMVGKGLQPSLVVTGMAGMGKTHIVKETLEQLGLKESNEFVHFKGRATAAGLYITLYENSDKIIILDDCDSVFKDDDAVNILKGALDSYDTRRISYITSRELKDTYLNPVPRQFDFTGKVIFISNFEQSKIDEAIKSRSFVQDISMTTEQVFTRMEQLINKIEPRIKKEDKILALSIMKELNETYQNVSVNLRSFIKASRICAMGFDNPKDMIADQIIED